MEPTVETVEQEHEQFLPHLEDIREVADSIGRASVTSLLRRIRDVHDFLAHRLMPHAVAEGRLMLPLVKELAGGREIAVEMNRCHAQLGRLTDQLESSMERATREGMDDEVEAELRRILYGIHAVLSAHLAQAQEVFTAAIGPDRTPAERAEMFEAVERSAKEVSDLYE